MLLIQVFNNATGANGDRKSRLVYL